MFYKITKVIAYIGTGILGVLAIHRIFYEGIDPTVIFFCACAFFSFEMADYIQYVSDKARRNAREKQPCIVCHTTGKVGGKLCRICGGKGWRIAPYDRDRPPIT